MKLPSPRFTPNLTPNPSPKGEGEEIGKNSVCAMDFETKSGAGEGVWVM